MSDFNNGALVALFSSILGFLVTFISYRLNKKIDEKKQIKSFLNAIRSEVINIWDRYNEAIGNLVENSISGEGIELYYPIFDKYFVIYDNNTNFIGNLEKELVVDIISTYTLAKSLKDSFVFNNQLLNEIRRYHDLYEETKINHFASQYQATLNTWKEYSASIKDIHFKLKLSKDSLINILDKKLN